MPGNENIDLDRPPGTLEIDDVEVSTLQEKDLEDIVRIDAHLGGRRRKEYFKKRVEAALRDTGVHCSLVARREGRVVGFLLSTVYYGEFGVPEPVATLDAIGVDPSCMRRRVASALFHQFRANVRALGIERMQTLVDWNQLDLLGFLDSRGFRPAARLCLEARVGDAP